MMEPSLPWLYKWIIRDFPTLYITHSPVILPGIIKYLGMLLTQTMSLDRKKLLLNVTIQAKFKVLGA